MTVWIDIKHAPKDGMVVDLWGYDRDPTPGAAGIMLPLELSLGRWTDCAWTSRMKWNGKLWVQTERTWYQVSGADDDNLRRIWPTHFMPIPAGPVKQPEPEPSNYGGVSG